LNDGTLSVDERSESFNPELTDEQLLDLVRKHLDQHVSKAANDEGEA
jgi:hypothetical protein